MDDLVRVRSTKDAPDKHANRKNSQRRQTRKDFSPQKIWMYADYGSVAVVVHEEVLALGRDLAFCPV